MLLGRLSTSASLRLSGNLRVGGARLCTLHTHMFSTPPLLVASEAPTIMNIQVGDDLRSQTKPQENDFFIKSYLILYFISKLSMTNIKDTTLLINCINRLVHGSIVIGYLWH